MKISKYKSNAELSKMTKDELIAEYKKYDEKVISLYEKPFYQYEISFPWLGCEVSALVLSLLNALRVALYRKNIICNYLSTPEKAEKTNELMSKFDFDTVNELASAMLGKDSIGTMLYYDSGARDYILSMLGAQSAIICGVVAIAGTTYYLAPKIKEKKKDIDKKNVSNYVRQIRKEMNSREQ